GMRFAGEFAARRGMPAWRRCTTSMVILAAAILVANSAAAQAQQQPKAESSLATSQDCTQITVDYVDDPMLTDAERIARMDEAFFRSLSRYEACRNAANAANAQGGSGASGGGGGGSAGAAGGMAGEDGASGAG